MQIVPEPLAAERRESIDDVIERRCITDVHIEASEHGVFDDAGSHATQEACP